MQEINVTISPAGKVTIDTEGFEGASCEEATKSIELVLTGGRVADTEHKPEYFQPATLGQEIKRTF
jgi:hypothetical protein